jgi:hypothetical protein
MHISFTKIFTIFFKAIGIPHSYIHHTTVSGIRMPFEVLHGVVMTTIPSRDRGETRLIAFSSLFFLLVINGVAEQPYSSPNGMQ